MTLPQAMVGLFPEEGAVTAVDTRSGVEHELVFQPPRTVLGLAEIYGSNKLAVNDELHVRALDDGKFAITPVARQRTPDYTDEDAIAALLDDLLAASVRMTEQEIRAVFEIPEDVDVGGALRHDDRFALHEGRWVAAASLIPEEEAAEEPSGAPRGTADASQAVDETGDPVAVGAPAAPATPREQHAAAEAPAEPAAQAADPRARGKAAPERQVEERTAQALFAGAQGASAHEQPPFTLGDAEQAGLWSQPGGHGHSEPSGHRDFVPPAVVERRAAATPPERVREDEDEDTSAETTELTSRFRRVMAPVGFQIEPVGKGQLRLVAAMGRRGYKVLVQLLSRSERLDWAELLSKRRSNDFRHLAVVGDHHDLLRLTGPAELARATLWSWQGLDRLANLHRTVPISPVDLEPHFERDGLFEHGLQRFEATVAERVAERGELSEVLARLNQMRAPAVFLLEDLVAGTDMPRDRALGVLERLSAAPFHLVARVDHGEFVLRQSVDSALSVLSSYALTLRERLPARQVEKLTGLGEPELLIGPGDEEDDPQADDVPTSEGGISA